MAVIAEQAIAECWKEIVNQTASGAIGIAIIRSQILDNHAALAEAQ